MAKSDGEEPDLRAAIVEDPQTWGAPERQEEPLSEQLRKYEDDADHVEEAYVDYDDADAYGSSVAPTSAFEVRSHAANAIRESAKSVLFDTPADAAPAADADESTVGADAEMEKHLQSLSAPLPERSSDNDETQVTASAEALHMVSVIREDKAVSGDKDAPMTSDPAKSADLQMEMHLQSLSAPIQAETQAKETVYVAEASKAANEGNDRKNKVEVDDDNDDDDDDWDSDHDTETTARTCRCKGRPSRAIRNYVASRPIRFVIAFVGVILIVCGTVMKILEVLDSRYLPVALLIAGCSLVSGIVADLTIIGLFKLLSSIVYISKSKEVEYFITATVFYLSNIRNALVNLVWCINIIIMLVGWVPRSGGSIVPTWETAFYHTVRILSIFALTILARIIAVIMRMYLVQDFGTRSYQEKVKETLSDELLLAKLRRVKPDPVLTSLQSRTQLALREGGTVDPELWQNLLRYVNTHHVDGLEPRNGRHQAVKAGVDNGLSKRSRPVAISVFAWLVARVDAVKKSKPNRHPRSRHGSFHSSNTSDSLEDHFETASADNDPDSAGWAYTEDRLTADSPPAGHLRSASPPAGHLRSASPPLPPTSTSSSSSSSARPSLRSQAHLERSSLFEVTADSSVRGTRSLGEVPRRRRKTPTTFAGVMRRAKAALDPVESRSSTPKSYDRIERLARNETLSYAKQKRKYGDGKDASFARLSLRFILKKDIMPILKDIDSAYDWEHIWDRCFDPKKQGFVTWPAFKDIVSDFYEARYNLALTLMDSQAVLKSMDVVIMSVLMMIVLTLGLALYSTELIALLASIGTVIVGYSFIFGSTVASSFENIVFLFGVHPYDVGDSLYMNGDFYTVLRIRLLTTDFLQMDGNFIRLENHQVAAMAPISNLSTSRNHAVRLETFIPLVDATESLMAKLKEQVKTYADNNPHLYAYILAQARDFMHPMRASGEMAAWGTHPTHTRIVFWVEFSFSFEDVGRVFDAQHHCVMKLGDIMRKLGIAKPLVEGPMYSPKSSASRERSAPIASNLTSSQNPSEADHDTPILQAPVPVHVHHDNGYQDHDRVPPMRMMRRAGTPPPGLRQ